LQKYKAKTVAVDYEHSEAGRRLPGTYQEIDELFWT